MSHSRKIYSEVIDHYRSCSEEATNINEIWHYTLNNKGRVYANEDLSNGLAPGSRVRGDIYDFNFYVDPTVLDLDNPITSRILELGQSDLGKPLKDVNIRGSKFSSKFISSVATATKIITWLNALDNHRPRIMEIGGGAAILLQVLKSYYSDETTLFVVDLPETLLIQEWLLRNCFPASRTSYKATSDEVAFVDGGINFINCYVLATQDIPVDLVINMKSFQEMDGKTCNAYLAYAAKNLTTDGLFYFENHFGHGDNSVAEPTEHMLDPSFTTKSADLCFQVDSLDIEENLGLWLQKTDRTEDIDTRRYVLRLLWNGFQSGLIPHNKSLVQELCALPRTIPSESCSQAAADILSQHGVQLEQRELDDLRENLHIDPGLFLKSYTTRLYHPNGAQQTAQDFLQTMWGAQSALNSLMSEVIMEPGRWSVSQAQEKVDEICQMLLTSVQEPERSEFMTANLACFLLPLGANEPGRDLILACASRSTQDYWLIRFARLLHLHGFGSESSSVLDQLNDVRSLSPIFLAVLAETRQANGANEEAEKIITGLYDRVEHLRNTELEALARASALMDYPRIAERSLEIMGHRAEEGWEQRALELLQFSLEAFPKATRRQFADSRLGELTPDLCEPRTRLLLGLLKHALGQSDAGMEMVSSSVEDLPMDYYSRGWAGNALMRAGFAELAGQCLQQSLALRPANFMECEFIGNVYFSSGHWLQASKVFGTALELIPYVRHLRAKKLYCDLPEAYREAQVFSDPVGLSMVFQMNQDFYSDILPSLKPRFLWVNQGGRQRTDPNGAGIGQSGNLES